MTDVAAPDRGSFCISELNTPDLEGAKRFYGDLFGWSAVDVAASSGSYVLFQLGGRDVAGMRRVEDGPHRWVSYVFVDSIAETIARAAQLGATAAAPAHTPGIGRTCVLHDPEGAELGLWEAGGHRGAQTIDVTGTMWWMELMCRDIVAARRFYTSLFGWTFIETPKYGIPYTVFKVGQQSVAGSTQFEPEWRIPPRWQVFFAISDFKATVSQACAMGGSLGFWRDVPTVGRLAVILDPRDALFIVMDPSQAGVS